jgi:NitT/TauT family transport system substrate-binding protein
MPRRTPRRVGKPGFPGHSSRLLSVTIIFLLLLSSTTLSATEKIRIAVLKFGTVSWEMDVIKRHALDRTEGFELEVVELAGKQATMVALQSGDVDIAITDWIWVSRQRAQGKPFTFVPYSSALGALVAAPESAINNLSDLKGKRIGIAGGPVDKSWLLFQALALREYDMDLKQAVTPVFGAPPLLNQQLKQGRIDAAINFWPYVARLEAAGMRRVIGVKEVARRLGIESELPLIGYVFDQRWAAENREALLGFVRATNRAKRLMKRSDPEWTALRPLMKAANEATFKALREGFRAGIPDHWGEKERADAEKLFAILHEVGGKRLVGDTSRLTEGTFWPEISY